MLRSDYCFRKRISVTGNNAPTRRKKKLTFKNNALFRSCMSKINNTFVDKTKDLDTVMPMYNLLEYNNNYSITLGNLWNYLNELK